jgi:hypothetical protein
VCTRRARSAIAAGVAARSECTATPAFTRGWRQARMPSRIAITCAGVVAKRRWSGRSTGCWKPARWYSTGSSVRPMPVAAAARASASAIASGWS